MGGLSNSVRLMGSISAWWPFGFSFRRQDRPNEIFRKCDHGSASVDRGTHICRWRRQLAHHSFDEHYLLISLPAVQRSAPFFCRAVGRSSGRALAGRRPPFEVVGIPLDFSMQCAHYGQATRSLAWAVDLVGTLGPKTQGADLFASRTPLSDASRHTEATSHIIPGSSRTNSSTLGCSRSPAITLSSSA